MAKAEVDLRSWQIELWHLNGFMRESLSKSQD